MSKSESAVKQGHKVAATSWAARLRRLLTALLLALLQTGHAQNSYYVSTAGSDSNSGLSPSLSWRSISYAASTASPVKAGDTVFIKAGDYGGENITFETSGTMGQAIYFIGYRNTTGDLQNHRWNYGDSLNPTLMPLLKGVNRSLGTGLTLHNQKYLHLENLQLSHYKTAVYGYNSHHNQLKNIICTELGDTGAAYQGRGIVLGSSSHKNLVENCAVLNACAEGISIIGDSNTIQNCQVFADDNSSGVKSAMDYYILIQGNYNELKGSYAERVGKLAHGGHGISLKGTARHNLISNCSAKGFALAGFNLRHSQVKHNQLLYCQALNCGFAIRDAAAANLFFGCRTDSARHALLFYDTGEDGGAQGAGSHNSFENCIFRHSRENVINFFYYDRPSSCDSNQFVNCLVDGGQYLFNIDRENNGNAFFNGIVTNVQHYSRSANRQDSTYALNLEISHSLFWNNGFRSPSGNNIYQFKPDFQDAGQGDYRLRSTSACIDSGRQYLAPAWDFDSTARPQGDGFDVGPFEYKAAISVEENPVGSPYLIAYPNPAHSYIILESETGSIAEFQIFDLWGRKLTKPVASHSKQANRIHLDLRALRAGLYLLKADGQTIRIRKL